MRLDSNKYRRTLNDVKPILLRTEETPETRCTMLALATEIPLLSVVLYALRSDVLGEDATLRHLATTLITFYRYTEVLDWTE